MFRNLVICNNPQAPVRRSTSWTHAAQKSWDCGVSAGCAELTRAWVNSHSGMNATDKEDTKEQHADLFGGQNLQESFFYTPLQCSVYIALNGMFSLSWRICRKNPDQPIVSGYLCGESTKEDILKSSMQYAAFQIEGDEYCFLRICFAFCLSFLSSTGIMDTAWAAQGILNAWLFFFSFQNPFITHVREVTVNSGWVWIRIPDQMGGWRES